jgi:preprotein translocase subunit SecB
MSRSINVVTTRSTKKAAFTFEDYRFTRFSIKFSDLKRGESLGIDFVPNGEYDSKNGLFKLTLNFVATAETSHKPVVDVECVALFRFMELMPIEALPEYFFANATAILYPYIRAFVSTLSLQANYKAFVLPTLNVAALGEKLKLNTVKNSISGEIG